MPVTKEEAIRILGETATFLVTHPEISWELAKQKLTYAGSLVGYKPAFRCLVMGKSPEESVKWSE